MKRFTKLALLAAAAAIFAGAFAGVALAKDTLIVANIYDAKTLDPIATNDVATSGMCLHVYDNLLALGPDGKPVPQLAEKYEIVDNLTYKFSLRKGVKFHNGEEMKAADVKYTFERAKTPAGASIRQYVDDIDTIEAIDDYTVVFKMKRPFTPFLMALTHTCGSILNKKAVEAAGDSYGMNPVGTGPFKFKSWAKGDRITLERNEEYWGKKPAYKTLVMRSIPEATNRTIELESGAIDIAYQITTNDLKRVQENPKLSLMRVVDNSTTYMGLNCSKPPFDNVKVREAVSLALDTVGIQKAVWRGVGKAPVAPIAPNILYAIKDAKPHVQDVEKAKKLLAEAGVKLPLNVQIWTNERKERIDMATIIQSQLEEVGIKAEIKVLEWGAYLDGLKQKTHDMFILGWVASVPDPEFAVSGVFHSSMAGSTNFSYFSNPEVDKMMEQGKALPNGPEREKLYKDLQEKIDSLKPWIYLHNDEQICGTQKNVKGFQPSPRGYHVLTNVSFE
jgi:peptide/nickel transport system substrate-binding protein